MVAHTTFRWGWVIGIGAEDAVIKNVYTMVQYTDIEGGGNESLMLMLVIR